MRVPELPFSLFDGYSAEASLSLAHDGRIPDGWMDLARDYDRKRREGAAVVGTANEAVAQLEAIPTVGIVPNTRVVG